MTQNKNPFQKKFATLAARAIFVCPISLLFAPKIAFLWQNLYYFSGKAWALKMVILNTCNWTFDDTKQKSISKKVCKFGCQSCFCMSYFIAFCSKNSLFVPKYTLATLAARVVFVPKTSIFDKICILFLVNHGNSKW